MIRALQENNISVNNTGGGFSFITSGGGGGGGASTTAATAAAAATSGSLADLRTVSFGPDGRPTTSSYLDDFPFPHYVLLRDAAGLPRALGGLVRRWVDAAAASSSSS